MTPTALLLGPLGDPLPALLSVGTVRAGFPSPAQDHAVDRIDLMGRLVRHPQATFLLRIKGDSMRELGILDGSVVVVDRAIKPRSGQVVIAIVDGEFTCKTLHLRAGSPVLRAANPTYPDITPRDGQELSIWGVVVASVVEHGT
jgi:DNA polymerase V